MFNLIYDVHKSLGVWLAPGEREDTKTEQCNIPDFEIELDTELEDLLTAELVPLLLRELEVPVWDAVEDFETIVDEFDTTELNEIPAETREEVERTVDEFDLTKELDDISDAIDDVVAFFGGVVKVCEELADKLLEGLGAGMINNDALETIVSPFSTIVVGFPAPADADGSQVKVKPSVVSVVAEPTEVGTVTVSNLVPFAGKEEFVVIAKVVLLRANASRIHDCRSNE
jgi:hypothetical protein